MHKASEPEKRGTGKCAKKACLDGDKGRKTEQTPGAGSQDVDMDMDMDIYTDDRVADGARFKPCCQDAWCNVRTELPVREGLVEGGRSGPARSSNTGQAQGTPSLERKYKLGRIKHIDP